jgi:hypothetical protein
MSVNGRYRTALPTQSRRLRRADHLRSAASANPMAVPSARPIAIPRAMFPIAAPTPAPMATPKVMPIVKVSPTLLSASGWSPSSFFRLNTPFAPKYAQRRSDHRPLRIVNRTYLDWLRQRSQAVHSWPSLDTSDGPLSRPLVAKPPTGGLLRSQAGTNVRPPSQRSSRTATPYSAPIDSSPSTTSVGPFRQRPSPNSSRDSSA